MGIQYTSEWLELEKSFGGRTSLQGTAEEMDKQFNDLVAVLAPNFPPPDPDVKREDKTVDGVPVRIYTPPGSGKKPVGLYTHGGGFVTGDLDSESLICDVISKNCGAVIVSVDYRLAPAHKHPAALEDSMKVYKWAYAHADELGGDTSKFFSIGGSAGGGLALSVANQVVKDPKTRGHIKGCVGIVPISLHPDNVPKEYEGDYKAVKENNDAPVINDKSMKTFYSIVGAKPDDADNFTGLAAENHKYFPKTYICVCEGDPLRDDGQIMEKMLKQAGVQTKIDFYKGLPHYFWIFPGIPEAQTFMGNLIGGVQFVLS